MFRSILLADSDVDSRDRFYEILFSLGHKVECVPNINEAMARLEAERPDLIILDEGLSPDGGIKALEKIRKFNRESKVVFLTKFEPSLEIKTNAHRIGVSVVIKKDFSGHLMFKEILGILSEDEPGRQEEKYLVLGKILVVDDTLEMRATLVNFLKIRGFDVREAANGDQALIEIKSQKPNLVLLDERMPGMDGLMALKKIKDIDREVKVVMLTGVEDEDVIAEAKRLGAIDYITKPCDLDKLEALVLSILIPEKYK